MPTRNFQTFISEIKNIPVLTDDQEKELTVKYHLTKNKDIKKKLIKHNLRLVAMFVSKYTLKSNMAEDLFQEGVIGLTRAIEKFDPSKKVKLSTYAVYWIRAYIFKYVIYNKRIVKFGTRHVERKLYYNLEKTKTKYLNEGQDISDEVLAQKLNVNVTDLKDVNQRLQSPDIRLDYLSEYIEKSFYGETFNHIRNKLHIGNSSSYNLLEQAEFKYILNKTTSAFLNSINSREQNIFKRRLINEDSDTLESIGHDLGITRERVRQIEFNLKNRFKKFLIKNQINGT